MARKQQLEDPVMAKVRALFDKSGLSLQDVGLKMGCTPETARQAVWQFLKKTHDPHISLLRRFAEAVGVTIEELVGKKKGKS
jgi:transcriptional regulator with XRE-family HTH domain